MSMATGFSGIFWDLLLVSTQIGILGVQQWDFYFFSFYFFFFFFSFYFFSFSSSL